MNDVVPYFVLYCNAVYHIMLMYRLISDLNLNT